MRKPYFRKDRRAWFVRTKSANGKDSQQYLADSEEEAYRVWERDHLSVHRGESPDRVTLVSEVVSIYVADMKSRVGMGGLAESTFTRRQNDLLAFMVHGSTATMTVEELKPYHVKDWLNTKETWGATTRRHAAEAIKRAIKWAYDDGRITANPLKTLKVDKGEPRDHLVTDHEWLTIFGQLRLHPNKRVRSFIYYLMILRLVGAALIGVSVVVSVT